MPTRHIATCALILMPWLAPAWAQPQDPVDPESVIERRLDADSTATFDYPPLTSNDPKDMCVYYHKRASAELQASLYEASINDFRTALSLDRGSATADYWCNTWGMQNDLSGAYASIGDHLTRVQFLKESLKGWEGRNARHEFSIWAHLNQSYRAMGRIRESEESLAALTRKYKEIRAGGRLQYNVDNLYNAAVADNQEFVGNYAEAERYRRASLENAEKYAGFFSSSGARGSRDAVVAYRNLSSEKRNLAANLVHQGKLAEAYYWAMEALAPVNGMSGVNSVQKSFLLEILSDISLMRGNMPLAHKYAAQSIRLLEDSGLQSNAPQLASRRQKLGLVLSMQERWPEAIEAYEERDRGLRSRAGSRGSEHIDWAMALIKTGQPLKAAQMLERMLRNQEKRAALNTLFVAEMHGYRGAALAQAGELEQAHAEFSLALPVIMDHLRRDAQTDTSSFIESYRMHLLLDAYLDFLGRVQREAKAPAGLDVAAEAFRVADIARGSSVQSALVGSAARSSISDPKLAALAREEQSVSSQRQMLQDVMLRLASASAASRLDKVIADMQADIARLAERQARVRSDIARQFPDYSQLIDPRPPLPADIQRVLGDNEVCISVYTNDTQSFVWTLTRETVAFRAVPLNRQQVTRWVQAVRDSVDLTGGEIRPYANEAAYRLYEALLEPDRRVWGQRTSLDMITNGALGQIPAGLLLTKPTAVTTQIRYASLPWLIRDVAIAQQPSASSLWALRALRAPAQDRPRAPFIGFGNPRFSKVAIAQNDAPQTSSVRNLTISRPAEATALGNDNNSTSAPTLRPTIEQAFAYLPQLPDTSLELQEIARVLKANTGKDLLLDTRASETEVKARDLTGYRVIAFATHGLIPGEIDGLDQPALALSNPALTGEKNNDGFLTLDEVLGLKLNADWVILSACNTASAAANSGEALSGLGRGFFYAGARSLLVSNWSVESVSARLLTTGIFEQQLRNPATSRAEALRQSMLNVMAAQPQYGHPAFWAPFTLAGDGLQQ